MKTVRTFAIFLVVLSFAFQLNAADLETALKEFRNFAAEQMKADKIPGMSIGYVRWGEGNDKTWIEGFGYSDLENNVKTKPNTAYRLGSVSKPLTAAAVLLLAERGKIDLDAEIQKYVPYFPKKKWPITVRQLLGHLGGISHYKNYEVEGRIKEHKSTREAIAIFGQFDLIAEPGTKYSYSSYGYNLLAAAVEGASGMPFGEFMKKNIWGPLNMNETRLDDPTDLIANRARGYRILQGEIKNSEFVDISSRLGAGGTRSTVGDLLKFGKGLAEGRILSQKSLDLMFSSMRTRDGHYTDYSTGWDIRYGNGHFLLRHSGSQQETSTILFCFPALKIVIAAAINQEDSGASIFAQRLFESLSDERWDLSAYVTTAQNNYRAMDAVFRSGMAFFELRNRPMTVNEPELREAFQYFQRSLIVRGKDQEELLKNGLHPVGHEAYRKVGSYMAQRLSARFGATKLDTYHRDGAIPFFEDYLESCRKQKNNFDCDFPKPFRDLVAEWKRSWQKTNVGEIRQLHLSTQSNIDLVGQQLRNSFEREKAYPDFSREIGDATWDFLLNGEQQKSLKAGVLGALLYPQSARLLGLYGISLVATSDRNRGLSYLKKAGELDPETADEGGWMSDFAESLADAGKIQEAVKVMQAAVELYPKNAKLLSDMGEAYLAMENVQKAREYFQKALAIDPKLERAKTMLEKLKQ